MNVVPFIILISTFAVTNESARILAVFPTPSYSHSIVIRPLVRELVKRGHEVVVVTTNPAYPKSQESLSNLTEIDVHDISYNYFLKNYFPHPASLCMKVMKFYVVICEIFIEQMLTDEMQQILKDKDKKFDLLLLEAYVRPALVLSHVFKAPVVQLSTLGALLANYETVGVPGHPLLYPTILHQRLYNLTFWEKVVELFKHYRIKIWHYFIEECENEMLRRVFGDDVPSVSELSNNVDMLFINMHPVWEGNCPVPPNVIHLGGLHLTPTKELPKDLKTYLDDSTNGVIYISFGTSIRSLKLPPEKVQIFVKVFSQLPYNVLWKWDTDELPGQPENVKISKWLPQSDLLRHPNVKVFITQGGLQSSDEAINAGVPMIGIPMSSDQWFNVEKYIYHKIGKRLDLATLTEEQLRDTINDVIGDKSYRENIIRLRTLMRDQPQSSLERAVWWTEYVIRHGGARHLRSPAANISWAEFLELKFVGMLLALLLTITSVILLLLYYAVRICRSYDWGSKVKAD